MATPHIHFNLSNPDFINWMRVAKALWLTAEAMTPLCKDRLTSYHNLLKKYGVCSSGCTNQDIKDKKHCRVCINWLADIKGQKVTKQFSLKNTTATLWPQHPWQIAQCYMAEGQDDANTDPHKTDPGGILQLVINCDLFRWHPPLIPSLFIDRDNVKKVMP